MAYSYDEAVEIVLRHASRHGFPVNDEGYEMEGLDTNELLMALDTDGEISKTLEKVNARNYAGINIAVLKELRRRKGEEVDIISADEKSHWGGNNSLDFKSNKTLLQV